MMIDYNVQEKLSPVNTYNLTLATYIIRKYQDRTTIFLMNTKENANSIFNHSKNGII